MPKKKPEPYTGNNLFNRPSLWACSRCHRDRGPDALRYGYCRSCCEAIWDQPQYAYLK